MDTKKIPIYKPYIGENENKIVAECMQSTWISSQGKFIKTFEEKVQEYTKANHAITVSNGTVAIHLAMLALGIGPGDEVITPNFTYVASSNSILYVGATPIFVDIDPFSWNLDPSLIEAKISSRTKAILYTNVYGAPVEYNKLKRIADKHGIYLIEDAAESFGATYEEKMSGTLGDISTFSFFGNKTITTGEGGMVLTPHKKLADKIRKLKNQGNSDTIRYYHDVLGYNYRMTNIQAAIGVAQLGKIDDILELKRQLQRNYEEGLKDLVSFQRLPENSTSSYWMCSILFKSIDERENIINALEKANIETRPFFTPIDELPFYNKVEDCPHTKEVAARGMNLPSFPALKKNEQDRIIEIIRNNIK
ncbi:DegT/DnrJ/EryC1/StrS family aminotransferase [Maribacter sp. HTCC2170]|uniref:DegT/DnrJ/EryC1/StrS family aminotransferase n=1 Tax=Maribacter sp. (strain HTCC2170 / KCCM 42371) TaxID=313603 RepID=UPI00006BD52D|nr:DegT/DnrJ/EryC1/StrS family aminotransferase [Maribacter sp. HTCC2170]EAR02774.1 perosamine synthetase [Maribacter sp. HTCC2170]